MSRRRWVWDLSARTIVARWVQPRRYPELHAVFALNLAEAALSYASKRLPRTEDRRSAAMLRKKVAVLLWGDGK